MEPSIPPDVIGSEPTSVNDVAARLRQTREALKMTQARLCRVTGITPAAWNNYETARHRISVDQAIKLCQGTGVTLDWIFRGLRSTLPAAIVEALVTLERERK